ncbi:MAG: hypothetical protein ACOYK5_02255 [Bacteroidia bacterium]
MPEIQYHSGLLHPPTTFNSNFDLRCPAAFRFIHNTLFKQFCEPPPVSLAFELYF